MAQSAMAGDGIKTNVELTPAAEFSLCLAT